MTIDAYIANQPAERQSLLKELHRTIVENDTTVTPKVGAMMGKEMILYHDPSTFKYGLASVKNYMSLHVMPIYGSSPLHDKYKKLLPNASFQKGCINFTDAKEMPLPIVTELIKACAKIDLAQMKQQWEQSKKG